MIEVMSIKLTSQALKAAREHACLQSQKQSAKSHKINHNYKELSASSGLIKDNLLDNELRRRKLSLLYYFLRSPLFDRSVYIFYLVLR